MQAFVHSLSLIVHIICLQCLKFARIVSFLVADKNIGQADSSVIFKFIWRTIERKKYVIPVLAMYQSSIHIYLPIFSDANILKNKIINR